MVLSAREKSLIRNLERDEETFQSIIKFRKDVGGLAKKRPELTKLHPNKWIAFYGGCVVSIADTLDELLKMVESKSLDSRKVVTQYLDTKKRTLIL